MEGSKVSKKPTYARIDQLGFVVEDIEKAIGFFNLIFHTGSWKVFTPNYRNRTYRGKPGNFKIKIAITKIGELEIELIQPVKGYSIYDEFLEKNGEGVHHIAMSVNGIKEKVTEMKRLGFEVIQSGKRKGAEFAYLHDKKGKGTIFEVFERFQSLESSLD